MKIHGLQKLTLIDYPGARWRPPCFLLAAASAAPFATMLRWSPKSTRPAGRPAQEVLDFLAARKGLLDGVCISGGEPCCSPK